MRRQLPSSDNGGSGGGIRADTATLTNSTISGNSTGGSGGGITATTATFTNATVSGNSAGDIGGGIRATTATLTNSTVSGNSAGNDGGGIYATVEATLTNSIVLGNDAPSGDDVVTLGTLDFAGGNIVGTNVFQGNTDVGNTTAAAVFAATVDIGGGVLAGVLADNGGPVQTIALRHDLTNPALDRSNSAAPALDARGEARFDRLGIRTATAPPPISGPTSSRASRRRSPRTAAATRLW